MEDMEVFPQRDSDAALKPFLQAAQESSSCNFSTLRSLVSKVLSDADIFAGYDQLKAILLEPLQKAGSDGEKVLHTLDLFSYGTFADYLAGGDSRFITLSQSQVLKLRQLTILSLVQHEKSDHLSYAKVHQALRLDDDPDTCSDTTASSYRAVEQILISCLYAGVVSGRLCQKTQSLRWTTGGFVSRDVHVNAVDDLLATTRQLGLRLKHAQQYLRQAEHSVQETIERDEQFWKRVSQQGEQQRQARSDAWSTALVGHPGLLTAEVTSAAAAMDVTGRRQKRSRGGMTSTTTGGQSAFQL